MHGRARGLRPLSLPLILCTSVLAACGAPIPAAAPPRGPSSAATACARDPLFDGGHVLAMPDGTKLWYKLAGKPDAPVVAYLHGGPGYNAYAFEKSGGVLLERHFRVLYIDQRGCGRSASGVPDDGFGMRRTVLDIDHLRAAVGAERMSLIAHSFGGVVAAEYVRVFPARVAAVVMVDTAPSVDAALEHQVAFADAVADAAFPSEAARIHALARSGGDAFGKVQRLYALVGRLPLQARLHFASPAMQMEMERLDAASRLLGCTSSKSVAAFQHEGYLGQRASARSGRLDVPVLLLAGRASEVIGKEELARAAQVWGAELRWVEGAGHFVYFEQPEAFANEVVRFLEARGS